MKFPEGAKMNARDHGTPQMQWGKKRQGADIFEAFNMPNTTEKNSIKLSL